MKKWILWRVTQCIATVLFVVGVLGVATAQVPETFTLLNGDSYTVGVRLDSSYDVTRLRQLDLYAGSRKIGYWTGTKAINSAENHFFRFKLSSVTTKGMVGKHQMVVGLKDIVFGQRNYILAYLDIIKTAGFSSGVVLSDGMDLELEVNPAIVNGLANARLTPLVKGYSAYEIAVHNGFTGTESAWLATFTVPKDTAVLARDQALIYKNAAAISAATASTQAINAATSATTATTQAASATLSQQAATTQATNASNSAASATLSQQAAATSATNASNSAASATLSQQAAATSATNASNSAASATTQATNASNSAATATTQAGIATTQATNASNSATAAATSATAAANSATTAATTLASKFNIPTGLTSGTLPKWNGTGFTNSLFSDNGTSANIAGDVIINGIRVGVGGYNNASNIAVGQSSLNSNLSGQENSSIGFASLVNLTSGSSNVAIGSNSGRFISGGASPVTNASNSVFIGSRAFPLGNSEGNQIVIGANAIGNGSNRAVYGNSSITDSRVYGNLLLGSNTNSGEALQVTGVSKLAGNVAVTGSLTTSADAAINGLTVGRGGGNGQSNTAFGINNLSVNTSGTDNTAIGTTSLIGLSSGSGNTGVGRNAGRYIADGLTVLNNTTSSTFLGAFTYPLSNNQTNQIVVGYNAIGLGSNTTVLGNSSTTFGRWYGNLLLGGNTNSGEMLQVTGTSKLAGNVAVTGSLTTSADATINGVRVGVGGGGSVSNLSIGNFALSLNSTGNNNTAVGSNTLGGNTIGANNTANGYASLIGLSSGSFNVAIGSSSGRFIADGTTVLTTSNQNILIGSYTKVLANNQTNQIVIGHDAIGIGNNSTLIGNSSTTTFAVWGDLRLMKGMATAPASSTATCVAGEIRVTADYIHVCTSTNVWKRAALTAY